jgi:hypothetical protein
MGYYVRKSLKAGPFRFNLSKSGVGVSAGVPGFRVGTGPRGNYVHVGRHGVYYRTSLNSPRRQAVDQGRAPLPAVVVRDEVEMQDVTGATAFDLEPAAADDLVAQLNTAAAVRSWWPVLLTVPVVGWLFAPWLRLQQHARRSVVVFYQVDDEHDQWFASLASAWEQFARSVGIWRILAAGAITTTHQRKVNSGASSLVTRVAAAATLAGPHTLVTNIAVPGIEAGRHSLYFLPDRVLVRDGRRFADISYAALSVTLGTTRFIEDGRVPKDSHQVGTTWEYANVKGGPDRRYKNNRQLPILEYARMEIRTSAGLHWTIDSSNPKLAESAIRTLGQAQAPLALEPTTT